MKSPFLSLSCPAASRLSAAPCPAHGGCSVREWVWGCRSDGPRRAISWPAWPPGFLSWRLYIYIYMHMYMYKCLVLTISITIGLPNFDLYIWLVVGPYPSEKNMSELVSWDYEIPTEWKNKIHVPNHQPVWVVVPGRFGSSSVMWTNAP